MIDYQKKLQLNTISDEVIEELAHFYQATPEEIKKRLKKIKGYIYMPVEDVDEFLYYQSKVWKTHFLLEFLLEAGFTVKQEVFQTDISKQKVLFYNHAKFYERYVVEFDKAKKLMDHIEKWDDKELQSLYQKKIADYQKVMEVYRDDIRKINHFRKKNIWIYNKFMTRFYKQIVKNYPNEPFCQSLHMEYTKKQYWNDENLVSKIDPNSIIITIIDGFSKDLDFMLEGIEKWNIIQNRMKYLNVCYHFHLCSVDEFLKNPLYLAYMPPRNLVLEIKSLLGDYYDNYQIQSFLIEPYIKSFKDYILGGLKNHTFGVNSINRLFLDSKTEGFCSIESFDSQVYFFVKPVKLNNPSITALHEFLHALEVTEYQDLRNERRIKCGLSLEQKNTKIGLLHYDLVNEVIHQLSTEELYRKLLENGIALFGNFDYGNRMQVVSYQNYYVLLNPFYEKFKKLFHYIKFHEAKEMYRLFQEFLFQDYYEITNILNECYLENYFNFQEMKGRRRQYYIKKMRQYTKK